MAPLAPQFDWVADKRSSITIHGVSLEACCFGPAPNKAPTIVLLHEGLGCIALWRDVPETLVRLTGHGVFAYSRQGYGKSDPAKLPRAMDYMRNEAIEVLPQVLDAFGFVNGVLMGHSDGASIAAIYAGSVQDMRVRGLVLLAPHFFTETDQLLAIESVLPCGHFVITDPPSDVRRPVTNVERFSAPLERLEVRAAVGELEDRFEVGPYRQRRSLSI